MDLALRLAQAIHDSVAEVPSELARWSATMDDRTFLQVMLFGAVILTLVIAKALR